MTLITAAGILVDGVMRPRLGLRLGPAGRIQSVAPLTTFVGGPDVDLGPRLLLPGAVDGYLPAPTKPAAADLAWVESLRAPLQARLQRGITCVAVWLPVAIDQRPLVALLALGQRLRLRLSLVLTIDLGPAARLPFEVACAAFEAAVGQIAGRRDACASWALGVQALLASLPLDACIALKLRFAHLPLLLRLVAAAGDAALPSPIPLLCRRGVADASTAFLDPTDLGELEARALASAGSLVGWSGALQANRGAVNFLRAHGVPQFIGAAGPAELGPGSSAAAGRALGIDLAGFRPGQWADLVSVPLAGSGPPSDVVQDVFVAGRPCRRDGQPQLLN